jgi:three-Cys-motif partner protein
MRNKWPELHYVDLFAGAGIERVEDLGLDWGSPLIGAQAPYRFTRLHLCEWDKEKFDALVIRIAAVSQPQPPQLIRGDANVSVTEIVATLPPRSLSLAFLDPYGLHLHYRTVQQLASRKADLIIFFPDHLDALRNWEAYYAGDPESNLDLFLGTGEWRARKAQTPPDRWIEILREIYEQQLRKLGYTEFEYERIRRSDGRPLYRLIFCSRDKMGGRIWRGISQKAPDGQANFQW